MVSLAGRPAWLSGHSLFVFGFFCASNRERRTKLCVTHHRGNFHHYLLYMCQVACIFSFTPPSFFAVQARAMLERSFQYVFVVLFHCCP